MADHNLVSFKVYFERGEGDAKNCEVRRFGIENDVATSYSYLLNKLKTVFPSLKNAKNIIVYWKDAENDLVRICSDAELLIALTEINETIKKLYIKLSQNETDDIIELHQENLGGVTASDGGHWISGGFHPNVTCDTCENSITGFRYKCMQCRNYDLCSNCEIKGLHPEHYMLRIPSLVTFDTGRATFLDNELINGFHCSKKHFKKLHHHIKHQMKHMGTYGLPQLISITKGFIPPSVNNTYESGASANVTNDNNGNISNTTASATTDLPVSTEAAASSHISSDTRQASAGCSPPCINENDDEMTPLIEGLDSVLSGVLTAVSNSVADYQRGCKDNESNSTTKDNGTTSNVTSNLGVTNPYIKNFLSVAINELSKAQKYLENQNNAEKTEEDQNTKGSGSGDENFNQRVKVPSIYPTAPNLVDDILTPEEMEKLVGACEGDVGIKGKSVTDETILQQIEADNGWTLLTQEKKDDAPKALGAIPKTNVFKTDNKTDSNDSAGVSETLERNKPLYIEEKINDTLNRLKVMGFSNEGNWLRDLIVANNGEIKDVLNELLPSH